MKKILISLFVLIISVPFLALAQLMNPEKINSNINIDSSGNISANNVKIIQFAGNTIYGRLYWGESSIKMTIKTEKAVSLTKKYGDTVKVSDMKTGDRINVVGFLEDGADGLTMHAKTITNVSDQKESGKFSGTIIGTATNGYGFMLKTDNGDTITISTNSSVHVTKGNRKIGVYEIKPGDRVINAEGVFNHANKTLEVTSIKIYIDLSVFKARNYQGTLKKLSSNTLPTTMTVTVGGKDYTVKLGADTVVLTKARRNTQLSRFVVGDTVRFYGEIPEGDDLYYVIGEVVRNVNL